jgi:ribosomal subunit interface protein
MEIEISDRAHDLQDELRTYVEERINSLGEHLDLIAGADVEFLRDVKKRPHPLHEVKINLHLLGHRLPGLRASATGHEPRITFDLAMAKIAAEASQLKEKVKDH